MYDKDEIRDNLTVEDIYDLLEEWGGEPQYTSFGLTARTICHNPAGEGHRKLYYYDNSKLFKCYTECDETFDIYTLVIKVMDIQEHKTFKFYDALSWIANYFHIASLTVIDNDITIEDWKYLDKYAKINDNKISYQKVTDIKLKQYQSSLLEHFNYNVSIIPWIKEGITKEVLESYMIGYYPGQNYITIPHFDINGNFIGLRGRALDEENAENYGKYRPLKINNILYNHPLGLNLYGIDSSKEAIKNAKKAIVMEGEKSVLKYATYFGLDNNISVACCGSTISSFQIDLLLSLGVEEIIIAFDRQFQEIGDKEFKLFTKKLQHIHDRFKNYANITIMFDKNKLTSYKDSPIDQGPEIFLQLFKERIYL